MVSVRELPTPALLLDLDVLEENITRQAARARRLGVSLRPHIKTHKCIEVARLQRSAGGEGITVSTLAEARVFADHGFDDILWAFPLIPSRVDEVRELAERVRFTVVVDSLGAIDALEAVGVEVAVWIKVDCGYHRAGVDPAGDDALRLGERLAASRILRLEGVLTHAGHSYQCRGGARLAEIAEEERVAVVGFARRLRGEGMAVDHVSVGSTPTMSAVTDLTGVTEMRPGNYTFHDYTQTVIGSAGVADCALTVLSTVVSSRTAAGSSGGWSVVDAG
ncbi:MAG: alanine racemase, partial [Deltaproteobacteria bacterium]|nr:alanine racemase [Deltaproteobacteria bacterium]